MSGNNVKHILLTGPPGIGKTTIVKKTCNILRLNNVNIYGFYTEECRDQFNKRNGFNIVSLNGQRERLSRTLDCLEPNDPKQYRVGNYYVFPHLFESVVLPLFIQTKTSGVLVLDEIGKMELFSETFQLKVKEAFEQTNLAILATLPAQKGTPIPFIEALRTDPSNKIITVNYNNRDHLVDEIVSYLYN